MIKVKFLYRLTKYKHFVWFCSLLVVLLGLVEFITQFSLGLFTYSVKVNANVQDLSIRYVPVPKFRNIREVTVIVNYEFKNYKYTAKVSEYLNDMRYSYLEDSDSYRKIETALNSKSTIDLVIDPMNPSKPILHPELATIRFYTYPLTLVFGILLFTFLFGENENY